MSSKPFLNTLSAKKNKKKGKKITRNVLTLREDTYWPAVQEDVRVKIENIFKDELSPVKCSKPRIPWYILMKLTKEQRKERIDEKIDSLTEEEKGNISKSKEMRKHLTVGVNSTVRNIEHNSLAFCLIDSTVEPKILLEKILTLSREKQILTALIPDLKTMTKTVLGFTTFILGFKVSITKDKCPISGCMKIRDILGNLNLLPLTTTGNDNKMEVKEKVGKPLRVNQERLNDVYLYRTSSRQRVFRPDTSENRTLSDFIQIESGTLKGRSPDKPFKRYTDSNQTGETTERLFNPPLVLTLQNNPNKKRKKCNNK